MFCRGWSDSFLISTLNFFQGVLKFSEAVASDLILVRSRLVGKSVLAIELSLRASLVAQMIKNLLAMQEIRIQSLGQEDPMEKGMTTHSNILAWGITWTEEPGGL